MNHAKNALIHTKHFVTEHPVAVSVTVATTAILTAVVVKKTTDTLYTSAKDFIANKGMLDEFLGTFDNPNR